ncbi:hypothetical protein G4Z16_28100 [Streptomyces bathyalis]|uniref:Uncharacterized protein n=1 Tax=Streptomyces bathyalis TaxID=2710756 RepID=A0A7T1TAX6_9ACTN|nr:hypothetical protein [Streptomyces bathyalis]QPP09636.1 hypothetical protein G4Z16_28100 [Streptomyces bathyalis]
MAETHGLRARRAVSEFWKLPSEWRDPTDMSDWPLRLTPDESRSLHEELVPVSDRYRRDGPGAEAPEDAERVTLITHILPELDDHGRQA